MTNEKALNLVSCYSNAELAAQWKLVMQAGDMDMLENPFFTAICKEFDKRQTTPWDILKAMEITNYCRSKPPIEPYD